MKTEFSLVNVILSTAALLIVVNVFDLGVYGAIALGVGAGSLVGILARLRKTRGSGEEPRQ